MMRLQWKQDLDIKTLGNNGGIVGGRDHSLTIDSERDKSNEGKMGILIRKRLRWLTSMDLIL